MSSIYSFFAHLLPLREKFRLIPKLEDFPFDESLLAARNRGSFPDLILRIEPDSEDYHGGELIELKDSRSYSVASFNSTIPSGRKNLSDIIPNVHSQIYLQMIKNGEDPFKYPTREVFYLIRGRKQDNVKVCLVHGSFFETVRIPELIQKAFAQVVHDGLSEQEQEVDHEIRDQLIHLLSHQSYFRKARDVQNASVKLRFRVMTEVKKEGNILNSQQYPQILDNTLNLILPCRQDSERAFHVRALLTPDAGIYGFPHYRFIQTFLSHGLILTSAIYLTVGEGLRPTWRSLGRVFLWTNVYMAVVFVINQWIGSNYLYIAHKPPTASILDMLPEWPYYIIHIELIGVFTALALYLPFALRDWRAKRPLTPA